ncbi:MAG: YggT family protein [Deltaproteobacteria bacterium]|nr:YggT family protein [Deltaproteobacteria bacterium]
MIIIARVVQLLGYIIIADVLLSWVQQPNQVPLKWTRQVTEPFYAPIRAVIPPMGGFDLSPLILIVGLQLATMALFSVFG